MKIAFLILAHNNPSHLHRLVNALSHEKTHCFLHVDRKSKLPKNSFKEDARVSLIPHPFRVYWGDFSMINAITALIEQAVRHESSFDRLVLLSGADYPVRPIEEIIDFFSQNPSREYINTTPMPNDRAGKPLKRLTHYKIYEDGSWIHKTVSKIAKRAFPGTKTRTYSKALGTMKPYGGSTWWALSREACEYLLDFLAEHKAFRRYFRNTYYPDEMLFHTILGNSPFMRHFARNLTYTDWSEQLASPAILDQSHLDTLKSGVIPQGHDAFGQGPMLFARKFNDESGALIQALEIKA